MEELCMTIIMNFGFSFNTLVFVRPPDDTTESQKAFKTTLARLRGLISNRNQSIILCGKHAASAKKTQILQKTAQAIGEDLDIGLATRFQLQILNKSDGAEVHLTNELRAANGIAPNIEAIISMLASQGIVCKDTIIIVGHPNLAQVLPGKLFPNEKNAIKGATLARGHYWAYQNIEPLSGATTGPKRLAALR